MAEKVFLDDKLVDIDAANISVRDGGFLYGAGLFETMRSCNGVVFALEDHLDRLFLSAKVLAINNTYSKGFIRDAIGQLLEANGLTDGRLRLTLTSGVIGKTEDELKSTLLITGTSLEPYPAEYYENGVLAMLCPFKQSSDNPVDGHKTLNYYPRMMALNMARAKGAAEALWFTVDNRLAEGCISNVFLVKDSVLYTPPIGTPVLAGVARKSVCQIALENSMEFVEKDLYIDDILAADEIFLTNVIMQVLPVSKLEKHTVGEGKAGVVSKKMKKSFDNFVKSKCGESK